MEDMAVTGTIHSALPFPTVYAAPLPYPAPMGISREADPESCPRPFTVILSRRSLHPVSGKTTL